MSDKLIPIKSSIETSHLVIESAMKNHAPQVSEKMELIGKPIGDRNIRKEWEKPADVKRTNFLARFKQFWAGSYLTRFASGETIFADLTYFRSLFIPFGRRESPEKIVGKINGLNFEIQGAFFRGDHAETIRLLRELQTETFRLHTALAAERSPARRIASSVIYFRRQIRNFFTRH